MRWALALLLMLAGFYLLGVSISAIGFVRGVTGTLLIFLSADLSRARR